MQKKKNARRRKIQLYERKEDNRIKRVCKAIVNCNVRRKPNRRKGNNFVEKEKVQYQKKFDRKEKILWGRRKQKLW